MPVCLQGLLLRRNDQEKIEVGMLEFVTKHVLNNVAYLMAILNNCRVFPRNETMRTTKENKK